MNMMAWQTELDTRLVMANAQIKTTKATKTSKHKYIVYISSNNHTKCYNNENFVSVCVCAIDAKQLYIATKCHKWYK